MEYEWNISNLIWFIWENHLNGGFETSQPCLTPEGTSGGLAIEVILDAAMCSAAIMGPPVDTNVGKTIITIPKITINRWYKPSTIGGSIIVLPTLFFFNDQI
jgi:hypothetical protein